MIRICMYLPQIFVDSQVVRNKAYFLRIGAELVTTIAPLDPRSNENPIRARHLHITGPFEAPQG